jgi:hypothetical protein
MLSDIEITDAERTKASEQQQMLRERLDTELCLKATFLTGSYRRNTQRRPLDDIDLFVVLDEGVYLATIPLTVEGAGMALKVLEAALRKRFPNSEVKHYDRCINIKFSNTGIGFDVIPAYQPTEDEFWIPDEARGWVKTNPKEQQRLVSHANKNSCGCMLVPAVKLIKTFNDEHDNLLRGFHIEAMVYHALKHEPLSFQECVSFLFERLSEVVLVTTPDIWPEGENADRYISFSKRLEAHDALRTAASNATEAIRAESEERIDNAHALWFEIFGEDYPETGTQRNKASAARPLAPFATVAAIRSARPITATSAGIVAGGVGLVARSSTGHGGEMDVVPSHLGTANTVSTVLTDKHREKLEREITRAQSQFFELARITPEMAAADQALWPVTPEHASTLYAVLVGEQRSNFGPRHRILVSIPLAFPAIEARIFPLVQRAHHVPGPNGFVSSRRYKHLWTDGSMCTHAARDGWDGRLVTLLTYSADWLVRQDYYQLTGVWLGAEIDKKGKLRINGRIVNRALGRRRS